MLINQEFLIPGFLGAKAKTPQERGEANCQLVGHPQKTSHTGFKSRRATFSDTQKRIHMGMMYFLTNPFVTLVQIRHEKDNFTIFGAPANFGRSPDRGNSGRFKKRNGLKALRLAPEAWTSSRGLDRLEFRQSQLTGLMSIHLRPKLLEAGDVLVSRCLTARCGIEVMDAAWAVDVREH